MKYIKKFFGPLFITCVIFLSFFLLRTVPVSKLWKGFSVLYVPSDTQPQLVFNCLNDAGCKDVISLYNQKIPFINEFLPVKADKNDSYLSGRKLYFYDKSKGVILYYIPDSYSKNAGVAASRLIKDYKIDAGLDCKSSFPLFTPIICLIVALCFGFFAQNRLVYLFSVFSTLLFSFAMPFYVNAASVCLFLYFAFLLQKIWKRKGSFNLIFRTYYLWILLFGAVIGPFFSSVLSGFLFILSLASDFCLLYLLFNVQSELDSRKRFNPVLMRPAYMMKMINLESIKKGFITVAGIAVLFILYVTSINVFTGSNTQDLSFPMPTRYNVKNEIPVLEDYIVWSWNTVTKPYRSLNLKPVSAPEEGETVSIQRYENTAEGIKSWDEILYCYDSNFKESAVNTINDLDYPAIEKLMKIQEAGFSVDYSHGNGEKFSKSNIILMLIQTIIPAFMTVLYLIGRRRNGNII